MSDYHTSPRLYVEHPLSDGAIFSVPPDLAHYLKNVLRLAVNDVVRIFNGRDGEWSGIVLNADKKNVSLRCEHIIHPQPQSSPHFGLAFAPIKGPRMDIMIEKAVELGVSDFYPIITEYTQNRHLNPDRITRHIIEAAEQCERLTISTLHPMQSLDNFLQDTNFIIIAGLERENLPKIQAQPSEWCFLVGPEGGFSPDEKQVLLQDKKVTAVNLGNTILRAETAAIKALSILIN